MSQMYASCERWIMKYLLNTAVCIQQWINGVQRTNKKLLIWFILNSQPNNNSSSTSRSMLCTFSKIAIQGVHSSNISKQPSKVDTDATFALGSARERLHSWNTEYVLGQPTKVCSGGEQKFNKQRARILRLISFVFSSHSGCILVTVLVQIWVAGATKACTKEGYLPRQLTLGRLVDLAPSLL